MTGSTATSLQQRLQSTLGDSYIIENELPPGGMSRLFLATERALDRKVVVKLLPPELTNDVSAQRFQREMLVTARLQHAHILPVLSAGARDGLLYYVTPYVAGESLRHRLARDGVLPIDETVHLLREMADALAFAHRQGIVHRDLKPANVLLQHGHMVLADFGIARALERSTDAPVERLTMTGLGLGTPGYMAPEQLAGDSDIDARTDIYALGAMAYETLSGELPFSGLTGTKLLFAQMTSNPEPLVTRQTHVPQQLSDVIMRCLQREPVDRWESAEELLSQLDELAADEQLPRTRGARVDRTDPELQSGIVAFNAHDWRQAFEKLRTADVKRELTGENLERLAEAAWWSGRIEDCIKARERAYARHVDSRNMQRAGGVALALSEDYAHKGARSVSHGWLQRAERHLADIPESPEHGWLARTRMVMALEGERDLEKAHTFARQTLDIGRRLGDRDLQAIALQDEGRILVAEGRVTEGMALIDEAMAAAASGQLGPRTTGRTYCNMMSTCEKLADYRRAGEWNEAAREWCEPFAESGFPGICRVHRAELLRLRGAWPEAEAEAKRASAELQDFLADVAAEANYEMGEVRLRMGDFETAEGLFRRAHELGRDPVPGLAMLRLGQGKAESAKALLDRALADKGLDRLDRAKLLPAHTEVALAAEDMTAARASATELEAIATAYGTPALEASAAMAIGSVDLAEGRAVDAALNLRRAWKLWKEMDLPYEAARTRLLLGQAYYASGNKEDGRLELQAAASSFERLGAMADTRASAILLARSSSGVATLG